MSNQSAVISEEELNKHMFGNEEWTRFLTVEVDYNKGSYSRPRGYYLVVSIESRRGSSRMFGLGTSSTSHLLVATERFNQKTLAALVVTAKGHPILEAMKEQVLSR